MRSEAFIASEIRANNLVNSVAVESAVLQDFPVLQPRQSVFHTRSRSAVDGVVCFLVRAEAGLTSSVTVRDEQAGALVAAVGDGRGFQAGPIDAGLDSLLSLPDMKPGTRQIGLPAGPHPFREGQARREAPFQRDGRIDTSAIPMRLTHALSRAGRYTVAARGAGPLRRPAGFEAVRLTRRCRSHRRGVTERCARGCRNHGWGVLAPLGLRRLLIRGGAVAHLVEGRADGAYLAGQLVQHGRHSLCSLSLGGLLAVAPVFGDLIAVR